VATFAPATAVASVKARVAIIRFLIERSASAAIVGPDSKRSRFPDGLVRSGKIFLLFLETASGVNN
jgi:hypothetical protein